MQWQRPLDPRGTDLYACNFAKTLAAGETIVGQTAVPGPGAAAAGLLVTEVIKHQNTMVRCRLAIAAGSQNTTAFSTGGMRLPVLFTITTSLGNVYPQTVLVNVKVR